MPELPGELIQPCRGCDRAHAWLLEVERARKLIQQACKGYRIKRVQTVEDKLVYTGGITHEDFVSQER